MEHYRRRFAKWCLKASLFGSMAVSGYGGAEPYQVFDPKLPALPGKIVDAVESASAELDAKNHRFVKANQIDFNPQYWENLKGDHFIVKRGVSASKALGDLITGSYRYSFECSAGRALTVYLAALKILGHKKFDRLFTDSSDKSKRLYMGPFAWSPLEKRGLLRFVGTANKVVSGDFLASPKLAGWTGYLTFGQQSGDRFLNGYNITFLPVKSGRTRVYNHGFSKKGDDTFFLDRYISINGSNPRVSKVGLVNSSFSTLSNKILSL